MAYKPTINPEPLKKLVVETPGVSVQATKNLENAFGNADNSEDLWAHSLNFKAPKSNKGPIYIGCRDLNRETLEGVILYLEPGEKESIGQLGLNTVLVGKYWVDADNAGDWVLGWAHLG